MADTIEEYIQERDKVVRAVTIEFLQGGAFNVKEDDKESQYLSWDEMLGTVAHMTIKHLPESKRSAHSLYGMTPIKTEPSPS